MKLAAVLAEQAMKILREEAGAAARATARPSMFNALSPHVSSGKSYQYTLRLPEDTGRFGRVMHYGVQPAFLSKTVMDTKAHINDLKSITPEKLQEAGLNESDASQLYRSARNRVIGRAAGDAVSWGLYPLAIANPAVHYPVVVGGAFLAPRLGERLGKQLS